MMKAHKIIGTGLLALSLGTILAAQANAATLTGDPNSNKSDVTFSLTKPKEDPDKPNKGLFYISEVPEFNFGSHALSTSMINAHSLNDQKLSVTDLRGEDGDGWQLSAKISPFIATDGKTKLKSATLTLPKTDWTTDSNSVLFGKQLTGLADDGITLDTNDIAKYIVKTNNDNEGDGLWSTVYAGDTVTSGENPVTTPGKSPAILNVGPGSTKNDYKATMTFILTTGPSTVAIGDVDSTDVAPENQLPK